jgi:hypothetical protein
MIQATCRDSSAACLLGAVRSRRRTARSGRWRVRCADGSYGMFGAKGQERRRGRTRRRAWWW